MFNGWINLNKQKGLSSAKATNYLKKIVGVKKAGHAGTLDPLAEGVLPVALGEATKTMSYAMDAKKKYEFDIEWGKSTDTEDSEGTVIAKSTSRPSKNDIIKNLNGFVGNIDQIPPTYSAIKINGKRSYELARNNIKFDIKPRKVFIENFVLSNYISTDKSRFIVDCSKGVYIRSLARDLAKSMGMDGHITYLKRLTVGSFLYKDAILLADIEKLVDKAKLLDILMPLSFVLDDIPAIDIDKNKAKLLSMGQRISIKEGIKDKKIVFVSSDSQPVALAKIENKNILPYRVFNF